MQFGDSTQALHRIWMRKDVMAASLGINVLALALPIAILQTYDRVIRYQSVSTFIVLALIALTAFALEFLLRTLRAKIMADEGARYDHKKNCDTLKRLLAADVEAFKAETPGTHADRFQAIQAIRTFYCQAGALLADVPFMLIFVGLIAVIAGWMAVVPVALLVAFGWLAVTVSRRLTVETGRRERTDIKRHNFLVEAIAGVATLKALGAEAVMQRRHERLQEEAADAFAAIARVNAQTQSIAGEIAQAASIVTVMIGAIAVVSGAMTMGALAATTILTGRLLQPVLKGLGLLARYPFIRLAEEKMRRIEALTPQVSGATPLPRARKSLSLDRVTVRATGGKDLTGVSLDLAPGVYIGITGQTGATASSLLKLMNGLVTPSEGKVRYDGLPLSVYEAQSLRRGIALLSPTPTVYAGTLLENLTMFEDGPVKRRALALCRALGLEQYVANLSNGLETQLSGAGDAPLGVAQRISIIRALAQNPRVILFDNANAALDHEADRLMLNFFAHRKGRRTVVFVTDRPSYLRLCDQVYEIADGTLRPRQVASGNVQKAAG